MTSEKDHFYIDWQTLRKYIRFGKEELAFLLKEDRFLNIKNCTPYFKKHLGFIYSRKQNMLGPDYLKIEIYNKAKFLFFKLKYGL
jgi:hypothetical protein